MARIKSDGSAIEVDSGFVVSSITVPAGRGFSSAMFLLMCSC